LADKDRSCSALPLKISFLGLLWLQIDEGLLNFRLNDFFNKTQSKLAAQRRNIRSAI